MSYNALLADADGGAVMDARKPQPAVFVSLDSERGERTPPERAADAEIVMEIARGERLLDLRSDWASLVARADTPNVFMNPSLVKSADDADSDRRRVVLLAWQERNGNRKLMGIWAFAIGYPPQSMLPADVLTAPAMAHGYLATPVIDREALDSTLEAMLACIANDATLPKIVALDAMTTDGATMQALRRVLAARGTAPYVLAEAVRPMLASTLDGKRYLEQALSSSSRKKLRQHRRRLAEKGILEYKTLAEAADVELGLEDFLALEAVGWKGREGTALASVPEDAAYTRAMIAALAAHGEASIHALTLDGKPVSLQIVLRAGTAAFTWKTAYDETLGDFSPGMLLLEDYTTAFLADAGITHVDSCAYDETSFMKTWRERQTVATVWFDATSGGSSTFTLLARLQGAYLRARSAAKAAYQTYLKKRVR